MHVRERKGDHGRRVLTLTVGMVDSLGDFLTASLLDLGSAHSARPNAATRSQATIERFLMLSAAVNLDEGPNSIVMAGECPVKFVVVLDPNRSRFARENFTTFCQCEKPFSPYSTGLSGVFDILAGGRGFRIYTKGRFRGLTGARHRLPIRGV
jgi:hypothetical protein